MAEVNSVRNTFSSSEGSDWSVVGSAANFGIDGGSLRVARADNQYGGRQTGDQDITGNGFVIKIGRPGDWAITNAAGLIRMFVGDSGGDRYQLEFRKVTGVVRFAWERKSGGGNVWIGGGSENLHQTIVSERDFDPTGAHQWLGIFHDDNTNDVVCVACSVSDGLSGWSEIGRAAWNANIDKTAVRVSFAVWGQNQLTDSYWNNYNVPCPLVIKGAGAENKTYDGNTSATATAPPTVVGTGSDDVTLTPTLTFADRHVGTGKTVTITGSLSGADASAYQVLLPGSATADITQKQVSATVTINNKAYDGTTAATIASRTMVGGPLGGDDASVAGGTAVFDDAGPGLGINVNVTGLTLSGAQAGNYDLDPDTATATANILDDTGGGSAPIYGQLWPR